MLFNRIFQYASKIQILISKAHKNHVLKESYRMIGISACQMSNQRKFENFSQNQPTFLIFPEIFNETPKENEFLQIPKDNLIPFDKMNVEKLIKASGKLSMEFEYFIDELSTSLRTEFADQDISNAKHNELILEMEKNYLPLNYVLSLLASFRQIRRNEFNFVAFDEFFNARHSKLNLRFNERQIYCFMCEMKARREFFDDKNQKADNESNVNIEQQQKDQIVNRYIREAKLFGQSLKNHDQVNVYHLINKNLADEERNFSNALINDTKHFQSNIISPQFLDCLPDHVITNLDLRNDSSVFQSFMRYCPDQNLRKDFWLSYNSRGSPYMNSNSNNFRVIDKIRNLRYRKARILGYDNFAQMSMNLRSAGEETMAGSVENVESFIQGLKTRSKKSFDENIKELENFATTKYNDRSKTSPKHVVEKINLWDLKYFERLYLRQIYKVDSVDVKAHFPLDRAFSGMLDFAQNLFGLKIIEQTDSENNNGQIGWGPNTRFFRVFSNNSKSMAELGSFYFDPFQNLSKVFVPLTRCDSLGVKPLAFFLMNFNSGSSIFDQFEKNQQLHASEKDCLLNFNQVIEMFGKFGHVLQHLLTEVKYCEINSIYNIEADALNLVSDFMKLWPLNSYDVIKNCSGHFETGQVISEEFYDRIRKAHYHFSSINLKNELYQIALDLNLHTTQNNALSIQKSAWNEFMSPFEIIDKNGYLCSASDIFSGNGMESILYSKTWSEVIAADIFNSFLTHSENGIKSDNHVKLLGKRFRETFLANIGAVKTNELFRRFSGRDPTFESFLAINGLQ